MTQRISRRALVAGTAGAFAAPLIARAEISEVRIAKQFGISYLPMAVIEDRELLQKHARQQGLGDVRVNWLQFAGGAPINDALIGGNLEFASGGVGPMVTLWARTRRNIQVRAVSAMNSMPLYLNSNRTDVHSIKDFTERDRIALPAVRVSIQAITLQMACEREFGQGQHGRLDAITVAMAHPDATNALLSARSEITAHFGSPPFQERQLEDPRIRRVLSSYDVLGGESTFNLIWTTTRVREQNPKIYASMLGALKEAQAWIRDNKEAAATLYRRVERSNLTQDFIMRILNSRENVFTHVPRNIMKYAEFMARTGTAAQRPDNWQEMFFPDIHNEQGS
jgi:NitT/TauT family transport system substrate-binding protein